MLTAESVATLVHTFVTLRVDYCNVVFVRAAKVIINKCNVWWMQQPAFWVERGVWPRLDAADAWQPVLAWHAGVLQT